MTAPAVDLQAVVERDFVAAWWLLADEADVERDPGPPLRWFRSGLDEAYSNAILSTHLGPDADADAAIDEMLARFRAGGQPGYWWVMPSASPADLAERLRRRGLEPEGAWPGMAVPLDDLVAPPDVPGLEIRRVSDADAFADYVGVFAPILSPSQTFTDFLVQASHAMGFGDEAPEEHLVGFLDGRPVATTSVLTAGGAVGIYNVTVLEEVRGRGIGAAITFAAIRLGARRGHTVATLQASSLGRPVYERLGFRFVVDLVPYRIEP